MDPVIEEMCRRVLNYGHSPNRHDLQRWCHHLQGVVQPQLEELERLKVEQAAKKSARDKVNA